MLAELLLFVRLPISHYFLGKVGRPIQIRPGEIEDIGPSHHCHFNNPKWIVVSNQSRNSAAANFLYPVLLKTQVDVPFPVVCWFLFVDLDRRSDTQSANFDLVFCREYDTMNAEAQLFAKAQVVSLSVFLGAAYKFVFAGHECNQSEG